MSTRDFRATQVRTHAIIGSGSSPQLLLYPSASATNQYGGVNLPGTGSDTWMFVSGAIGTTSGKVVFGGDVIISGSVNAIGGGTAGTNYFSSTTTDAIFTTGSAAFRGGESSVDAPSDKGSDVFFYVSGTRGGSLSSSRKVLFGGDTVTSGTVKIGGSSNGTLSGSGDFSIFFGNVGSTNSLYIRNPNSPQNKSAAVFNGAGSAYTLELSGGLYVNSMRDAGSSGFQVDDKDGGSMANFDTFNKRMFLSASQVTVGSNSVHGGTDVNFFVSGAAGSRGTSVRGTSVFAGDVTISGSLVTTGITGSNASISGDVTVGGNLTVNGTTTTVNTVNLIVRDPVVLIGSGSVSSNSNGGIAIASGSTETNKSLVFGRIANDTWGAGKLDVTNGTATSLSSMDLVGVRLGKVEVGGTTAFLTSSASGGNLILQGNSVQITGSLKASNGISGSITNLSDGRSFLVAGSNVTITSASDGQITIASAGGGGGSPGGSNTYVQFNNAGSFGGDSGLTYDQSTDTLKATVVTASLGFSGSLTTLNDGSAYIRAGTSNSMAQTGSISITSASNGAVTVNAYVFPSDITISLSGGRTFGRYASGETIPATGKTPAEVILLATAEPIAPTVPTPTATNPITSTWNTTGSITTSVTASYTINSLGASVSTATLQFRSGSVGAWNTLSTSTTNPLKYDHTFTVGTNFTTVLNYQYIVLDSAGAAATGSVNLTPQSYTAPTIGTLTMARSTINGITGESNTTRERGNVFSEITGTITRNRTNAQLSSYAVQYSVNGGAYSNVTGFSGSITGNPSTFTFSGSHNDVALKTSVTSSLAYRVSVVDTWTTSSVTPSSPTITFYSAIFYGTASAAPTTSADVRSLGNKVFTTTGDPFNLDTGTTNRFFVVALPTRETSHDTIASVTDTSALNADITTSYVNSPFGVNDGGGVSSTYNVYTMEIATPYSPTAHTHSVDRA